MKVCATCGVQKPFDQFNKRKYTKCGLCSSCKECRSAQEYKYRATTTKDLSAIKRTWYTQNRNKVLEHKKVYHLKTRDARISYMARWFQQNKDAVNLKRRLKPKIPLDKQTKIAINLRSRLNKAVRKNQRTGSAIEDLGCSISDFLIHIEKQFEPGMSWENYGRNTWHLDHIVPLNNFDLTDPAQLKRAVHFTNIRPLWAKHNLGRSKKLPIVYLVTGAFGAGKSWICTQLERTIRYVSYDKLRGQENRMHALLNPPDLTKPTLYDQHINLNKFFITYKDQLDIRSVFILENESVIKERLIARGGVITSAVLRKIKRMEFLAKKYALFAGTSNECLEFLKKELKIS